MRYENPLYMAEEAAAADLISGGRLQLGVSRGSPETALKGSESFGFVPPEGTTDADLARAHTELFLAAIQGAGVANANPQMTGSNGALPIQPQSPGLIERIWWGAGSRATGQWTAQQGLNLMSSTLLTEDTGVPFGDLQAEQIALFRAAWKEAGWEREPRVSISRSILPITTDEDRSYFGARGAGEQEDQVGYLDADADTLARFGKSYIGEPDDIVTELLKDAAVREADTILLTVPNQLGVEYNTHLLETVATHIAPAIGWQPAQG
jgi:alkanesulfonate monooxygenase SsuD/methylene tetrahydromethanopterin reductase-like flavin-dependent oxidoreductase (luciferase family)